MPDSESSSVISQGFTGDTDGPACSNCTEAGVECVRSVNVRFRNGLEFAKNHEVAFPESNVWPRFSGSSTFFILAPIGGNYPSLD